MNSSRQKLFFFLKPKVSALVLGSFLVFPSINYGAINASRIYQLQQQLIDSPRDIGTYLNLAMEYSIANDFLKSVEAYFTLLRVDPNNFHAYNNLGILYKKSGQYRDSLYCYEQAEKIDPNSPWVPFNKGLCYESIGRLQDARESYGRALSLNPSFNQALQRLKALTSNDGSAPVPEVSEMQVYVASAYSQQPSLYVPAEPIKKADPKVAKATLEPAVKPQARISDTLRKIKESREKKKEHRTKQKGTAAENFNKAMDAFDLGQTEKALELYAQSITENRDLLSEPDNGLIKASLEYLKDNPNRVAHGLYYRGLLIFISGHLELAVGDLNNYVKAYEKSGSDYLAEAKHMLKAYEQEKQAIAAAKKAKKEHEALLAAKELSTQKQFEADKPRPSDYMISQMNVDQIIAEADRFSRESRISDALAVIESGLSKDPNNIKLLMKSANAYTDLLLVKSDKEAGKMALKRFERVYANTPENSREWSVAKDMIFELRNRVK